MNSVNKFLVAIVIINILILSALINIVLIVNAFDQIRFLTRVLANIRFGHYDNRIESFNKVIKSLTKSFLFLFPNGLAVALSLNLIKL